MNPDDYIKDRVDGQIGWYDRKSGTNQRWFRWLRIVEIIAAASIPLLVGYADSITELKVVVGILGLLIAVIAGVLALYQFQENWTGYRTTCEALTQEKYLFLTKTQPYDQSDSFSLRPTRRKLHLQRTLDLVSIHAERRQTKESKLIGMQREKLDKTGFIKKLYEK